MSGRYATRASPSRRPRQNKAGRKSASPPKRPAAVPRRVENDGARLLCAAPLTNSPAGGLQRRVTWEAAEPSESCMLPQVHHGSLRVLTATMPKQEDGVKADPVAVVMFAVITCMVAAVLLKELESYWAGKAPLSNFGWKTAAAHPAVPNPSGIDQLLSLARSYLCAALAYARVV